jgi:transposase
LRWRDAPEVYGPHKTLYNRFMRRSRIPSRSNRIADIIYYNGLYKTRGRIEIMFGRLKDWRRIAMRYDRAAHTFFSAIRVAATVIFWL